VTKQPRSFTIDEDLDEELRQRSDVNASGVVNDLLRDYLEASDATKDEVILRNLNREIDELEADIAEQEEKLAAKKEKRQEVKRRIEQKEENEEARVLERLVDTPADPTHASVVRAADEVGMTPEALARRMAQEHDKTYQDGAGGLRSQS